MAQLLRAMVLSACLVLVNGAWARAELIVVDFHTIVPMDPLTNIPTPYTENGFTITTVANGAPNIPLGMFGPADPGYTAAARSSFSQGRQTRRRCDKAAGGRLTYSPSTWASSALVLP